MLTANHCPDSAHNLPPKSLRNSQHDARSSRPLSQPLSCHATPFGVLAFSSRYASLLAIPSKGGFQWISHDLLLWSNFKFSASVEHDVPRTRDADGCASGTRAVGLRTEAYPSVPHTQRPIRPLAIQSVAAPPDAQNGTQQTEASPFESRRVVVEPVKKSTRYPTPPDHRSTQWTHSCPRGASPHRRPVYLGRSEAVERSECRSELGKDLEGQPQSLSLLSVSTVVSFVGK